MQVNPPGGSGSAAVPRHRPTDGVQGWTPGVTLASSVMPYHFEGRGLVSPAYFAGLLCPAHGLFPGQAHHETGRTAIAQILAIRLCGWGIEVESLAPRETISLDFSRASLDYDTLSRSTLVEGARVAGSSRPLRPAASTTLFHPQRAHILIRPVMPSNWFGS